MNATMVAMFYGNFDVVMNTSKPDWLKIIEAEKYKEVR